MGCGASKKKDDKKEDGQKTAEKSTAGESSENSSNKNNESSAKNNTASSESSAKNGENPSKSEENPSKSEENPPKSEENPPKSEENPSKSEENPSKSEENEERPQYVRKRRAGVSAEAVTAADMSDDTPLPVYPKSDEAMERIMGAIKGHLLFRHLEDNQLQDIVKAMFEVKKVKGEVVIRQGDQGDEVDNFYIVEEGECEVLIARGGEEAKHFSFVKPGGYFGELALMYSTPRAATVQVSSDEVVLWAVDRTTFRRILLVSILQRRHMYEEFLASVPILDAMTSYETSNLCDALEVKHVAGGDTVYTEGESGSALYIVEEGSVSVSRGGEKISTLGRGEAFGEVVLLTEKPYDATVTADVLVDASSSSSSSSSPSDGKPKGCKLLTVDRATFNELLGPCIDMLKRNMGLYRSLSNSDAYGKALEDGSDGDGGGKSAATLSAEAGPPGRTRSRRQAVSSEALVEDSSFVPTVVPKTDEQRQRILKAIAKNFLFSSLTEDVLDKVVLSMFEVNKESGDVVMAQGDEGDNFYILEDGECEFIINGDNVGKVNAGGSFGELALMYDSPRAATVKVASEKALLWGVDRQCFRQLVLTSALKKRRLYESFLAKVSILSSLTAYERSTLADALKEKSFARGENIVTQGDTVVAKVNADEESHESRSAEKSAFFIISEGEAVVTTNVGGAEKELKRLAEGDYFGEIALLEDKPRAATVSSDADKTTVLYIEGDAFHRILGSIEDILRRNMDEYEKRIEEVRGDVTTKAVEM